MKGDGIPRRPVSGPLLPPRKDFFAGLLGRRIAALQTHPAAAGVHPAVQPHATDVLRKPRTRGHKCPGTAPRPALRANRRAIAAAARVDRAGAGGAIHGAAAYAP